MSSCREACDKYLVRVDSIFLCMLTDVLYCKSRLYEGGAILCVFVNAVAKEECVEACGEIEFYDALALAVGEKAVSAAGSNHDSLTGRHLHFGSIVADICSEGCLGVFFREIYSFVDHICVLSEFGFC